MSSEERNPVRDLAMRFWDQACGDDRGRGASLELLYDALPPATRRDLEVAARDVLAAKEALPKDAEAFVDISTGFRLVCTTGADPFFGSPIRASYDFRITLGELDSPEAQARIGAEFMRTLAERLPRVWPDRRRGG